MAGDSMLVLCDTGSSIPLRDRSVHCVVTSPPYWALRDYGDPRQIGLEPTPDAYVARMVAVFREVRRVLRDDGTLWLNIGDSYGGDRGNKSPAPDSKNLALGVGSVHGHAREFDARKQLIGIPWRLALALQSDGWYLRSDCIWAKPNPMPESVTDRPTKAHEYVFLLTKSPRYFYDAEAVKEEATHAGQPTDRKNSGVAFRKAHVYFGDGMRTRPVGRNCGTPESRNRRTVWTVPTRPFKGSHFATMPPDLAALCIKAGTSEKGCCPACGAPYRRATAKDRRPTRPGVGSKSIGLDPQVIGNRDPARHVTTTRTIGWEPGCDCDAGDPVPCVVLDPFSGSGTTVVVARELGRIGVGLDVSRDYMGLAVGRIREGIMVRRRKPKRPASPSRGGIQFTLFD